MDVVIIGAGIAGLAAARRLQRSHARTLVLEARERLGGRIFTRAPGIELGAEFLHGDPLPIVHELGLTPLRVSDVLRSAHGPTVAGTAKIWRLKEGMSALIERMAEKAGPIRLNSEVARVEHNARGVTVVLKSNEVIFARAVLCTVPLAVLRSDGIVFDPPLEEKMAASSALAIGQAHRVIMELKENVLDVDGFVQAERECFNVYWTSRDNVVTAFCGGPGGNTLLQHCIDARLDDAWNGLSAAAGTTLDRSLLLRSHWHDFAADPLARGAFSCAAGGHIAAALALAKPHNGVLFFAGEATHPLALGTVHGAFASGERAAVEVGLGLKRNERTSRRAQFRGSASLHRH